jgi:hypothetical protein
MSTLKCFFHARLVVRMILVGLLQTKFTSLKVRGANSGIAWLVMRGNISTSTKIRQRNVLLINTVRQRDSPQMTRDRSFQLFYLLRPQKGPVTARTSPLLSSTDSVSMSIPLHTRRRTAIARTACKSAPKLPAAHVSLSY